MFERFTEKARRVIFFARYEVSQAGGPTIEPEHLLLGLLRETKSLFEGANIDEMTEELRRAVHVEGAPKTDVAVDVPLSESAKHVLVCSLHEAGQLHHAHIGPEHMLLALMQEPGFPARMLEKHKIQRDRIVYTLRQDVNMEMKSKSRDLVHELEQAFTPLAKRLTPDIEPAVLYALPRDTAS
jgi:ATP-dependent Clp protease ATP-binding subunit ClpC